MLNLICFFFFAHYCFINLISYFCAQCSPFCTSVFRNVLVNLNQDFSLIKINIIKSAIASGTLEA